MTANTPPQNLLRTNMIVGFGTFLSRITGFMRVLLLASVFGFTGLSDVYNTANTTPHIIYELLLGGILSATLLPVFVRQFAGGDSAGMSAVLSVVTVALGVLTMAVTLCAPFIISLYAVSRGADHALFLAVGTNLAYCFLPQIFFYGVIALATAMLNARQSFAVPAYAPILNNIIVMAVLGAIVFLFQGTRDLEYAAQHPALIWVLGLGTTAGIIVSTLVLLPFAKQTGLNLSFHPDLKHPAVQKVLRLSGWTLGYVAANQVALYVITTLALSHESWLSVYQTAFIFFLLPHGLFAVSIMSTFAPDLARSAARFDWVAHKQKIHQGVRVLTLLMLPAGIGYALVASPVVDALLHHGRFDAGDGQLTSATLAMFALGLLPFSLYLFFLRSFYALEDTRSVFFINVFENILNIALALPLMGVMGVAGLALSYTLAYTVSACVTGFMLARRLGGLDWNKAVGNLFPVVASVAVMAATVLIIQAVPMHHIVELCLSICGGGAVYAVSLLVFRVPEALEIGAIMRRKLKI